VLCFNAGTPEVTSSCDASSALSSASGEQLCQVFLFSLLEVCITVGIWFVLL